MPHCTSAIERKVNYIWKNAEFHFNSMLVWLVDFFILSHSVSCDFSWQIFYDGHKSASADHLNWRHFHVIGLMEICITSLLQEQYNCCTWKGNTVETMEERGKDKEVIYSCIPVTSLLRCDMIWTRIFLRA